MDLASVKLTEEQMREAEQHYKQIDEKEAEESGENVREDEDSNDAAQEEESKEPGQTSEDQPTQLAKKLSLGKQQRTVSI